MTLVGTVVTTAVAGVFGGMGGAVIIASSAQARERRDARAQAREALRRAENLSLSLRPGHQVIKAAHADLETRALLARLPRALVELYCEAMRQWAKWATTPADDNAPLRDPEATACGTVARQAARLLTAAAWHPWGSAPQVWWRTRRLRRVLAAAMPLRAGLDRDRQAALRQRERQLLRAHRKTRRGSALGA
jgi:type II secretory pathway pseudopilin PulG